MRFIDSKEKYYVIFQKRESYYDSREVYSKKVRVSIKRNNKVPNNGSVIVAIDLVNYIKNNENSVNNTFRKTLFDACQVPKGRFHIEHDDVEFVEEVLKNTVEGQELLEKLISEFTSWEKPMKLSYPKRNSEQSLVWCSDYKYMDLDEEEKWESSSKESFEEMKRNCNPLEDFFWSLGTQSKTKGILCY